MHPSRDDNAPLRFKLLPELLQPLVCPTCRGPLICETREPIEFGKVHCSCGHYPVVAGVLLLDRGDKCNRLLSAIDAKEWDFLHAMLLREFCLPTALVRRQVATFSDAVGSLIKESSARAIEEFEWFLHAKYWEATPKYLAALRLTPFLSNAPALPTLDLASGFGHLSNLYREFLPCAPVYLLDCEPLYLIMAAYVLGKERLDRSCMIAMNVETSLPFKAGSLGSILNSDSFFDFPDQPAALRACREALSSEGILLFTHLHNQRRPDEPFQQASHDFAGWREIFERNLGDVSVLSDDALRASLNAHDRSLATGISFDNPRSYSVVFPAIDNLPPIDAERIFQTHIKVNPVFEIQHSERVLRLVRRKLTPLFESEHETERFPIAENLPYEDLLDKERRLALLKRAIVVRSCQAACSADVGGVLQ